MPWSPPSIPISGTTITVSFATSLINNGLNWLRQLTGNGDPPAADYVAVSTSTTTTSWQKITTNVIADGNVADVKLTNQKVNAQTPTATSFANLLGNNLNGFWEIGTAPDGPVASQSWYALNHVEFQIPLQYGWQLATNIADQNEIYLRLVRAGVADPWRKMWHAGNDGSGSGLDADLLDGQSSAFYATASSVAAINSVPSGLIAAFATAGAIASGWSRYTAADGRILIGAGTTFSQTFTENTNAGTGNWTPLSGTSVNATGSGPFLAASSATNNSSGSTNVDVAGHQHAIPTTTWIPPVRVVVHAQKS